MNIIKWLIVVFVIILAVVILVVVFLKQSIGPKVPLGCSEKEYLEAVNTRDVGLCSKIKLQVANPYYSNMCEAQCIESIAIQKSDPNLCEFIIVKDIGYVEGWENPSEVGSYRDFCYRFLAEKLNDRSLCDKVKGSAPKRMCLYFFGEPYM